MSSKEMAIDFWIQDMDQVHILPYLIKANLVLTRKFNLNFIPGTNKDRISPPRKISYGSDGSTTYLTLLSLLMSI